VDFDDGLQMSISKNFYTDDLLGDDQLMFQLLEKRALTLGSWERFNSL